MSLAAGPGRGRVAEGQLPDEIQLVVDKHVAYIQDLDTVRSTTIRHPHLDGSDAEGSAEMSSNII